MVAEKEEQGRVLALSFRPKSFRELVGLEKITSSIQQQVASGRLPAAWMFLGQTGVGKTTLARILAVALQCGHQEEFGSPCERCWANVYGFSIAEINASEVSGVADIQAIASTAQFAPTPPSAYRVYILDEAQRLSSASQNLLLKHFEDAPATAVWIVCTTDASKILPTLRGRCARYYLPLLNSEGIAELVDKAVAFLGDYVDVSRLVDELAVQGSQPARQILYSLDRFLSGAGVEEAVLLGGMVTEVQGLKFCQTVVKGDWRAVTKVLERLEEEEAQALRGRLLGYLRKVLVGSEPGKAADQVAEVILRLVSMEGRFSTPEFAAVLYGACAEFSLKKVS